MKGRTAISFIWITQVLLLPKSASIEQVDGSKQYSLFPYMIFPCRFPIVITDTFLLTKDFGFKLFRNLLKK